MAKVNPITTYTSKVVASNTSYNDSYKLTLPFKADRVWIGIIASTGNEDLVLSFDGTNDAATMHHTAGAQEYQFAMQEIDTLYYKLTGAASVTFIVNAECKSWPNIF